MNGARHINPANVHLAQVEHGPSELLSFGVGDDFVFHLIIIYIGLQCQSPSTGAACRSVLHEHAQVNLCGAFGLERGMAQLGVVEVVEGGQPIASLHKRAKRQPLTAKGIEVGKYRRRELVFGVLWRTVPYPVVGGNPHHRGLHLQVVVVDGCCQRKHVGEACRESKVIGVGKQLVPSEVVAERCTPVGQQLHHVGCGKVQLLLVIDVVDGEHRRVAVGIVCTVIGILRHPACAEPVAQRLLPAGLDEAVQVFLSLASAPHIVHDGSRNAAVRVVDIGLEHPLSAVEHAMQVQFHTSGLYVAVLSGGGGVPSHSSVKVLTLVAEPVLPAGRCCFGIGAQKEVVVQFLFPKHRRA